MLTYGTKSFRVSYFQREAMARRPLTPRSGVACCEWISSGRPGLPSTNASRLQKTSTSCFVSCPSPTRCSWGRRGITGTTSVRGLQPTRTRTEPSRNGSTRRTHYVPRLWRPGSSATFARGTSRRRLRDIRSSSATSREPLRVQTRSLRFERSAEPSLPTTTWKELQFPSSVCEGRSERHCSCYALDGCTCCLSFTRSRRGAVGVASELVRRSAFKPLCRKVQMMMANCPAPR